MHLESTALKFLEESLDRLKKKIFIAKVKGLVHRFNSRSDLYHNYDLFFISRLSYQIQSIKYSIIIMHIYIVF